HIDVHDLVVFIFAQICKGARILGDACAVACAVELAEEFNGCLHQCADVSFVRYVGFHEEAFAAERLDDSDSLLALRCSPAGNDAFSAFSCECYRRGSPDSGAPTGDDYNLVSEQIHKQIPSWVICKFSTIGVTAGCKTACKEITFRRFLTPTLLECKRTG